MLQHFLDMNQKITVNQINLIMINFGIFSQIPDVIIQYPENGTSGIEIIIQCYHLITFRLLLLHFQCIRVNALKSGIIKSLIHRLLPAVCGFHTMCSLITSY